MINLSVIVPFFNEEDYLEKSINRLLKNNIYEEILFLVDNNSTDESSNIAKKLVENNKSISLYKTDEKKGKGVALSHAKEFITARML